MSGRTQDVLEEIRLKRGPAGLGFNIVGGTDQQYVASDSGIYVSSLKENGAAAIDGRLQEGDRILEVNGYKLDNLLHNKAVELFRNAGEDVVLKVQHKFQNQQNGPSSSKNDTDSDGPSLAIIVVPAVLAVTVVVVWAVLRYRQRI
ncbi:synaptojanin-2-binding protein-like [Discoglossus pictus]